MTAGGARTRRRATGLACLLAALALAPPVHAARWDVTTTLESDSAWRVRSPHRFQKSQNRIEIELELAPVRGLELRALGRLLYDPAAKLVGPNPDFGQGPVDRWQVAGSRHLEAELRELHVDWRGRLGPARVDLRLGKQQVVWGQSFGLRVLDVVNPQDFREFVLDDFVDARTPLWGLRADTLWRGVALQLLLFPDFEADALPAPESAFGLDPALRGLLPALAPPLAVRGALGRAPIVSLEGSDEPADWDLGSWAFGGRLAGHVAGVDWGLYYFDRHDPRQAFARHVDRATLPDGTSVPINRIEARHPRVRTAGFSFSTAWRDFVLWGEGGLTVGRAFASRKLDDRDGLVSRSELQTAIGLDWTGWEPLFANLQWIQFAVFDHDRSVAVDRFRNFLSLLLRFDLRDETVFPQLFVLYGLRERESMIRPSVEWKVSDRWSVTAGADLFTGPREGLFGQYARRRRCVPVITGAPVASTGGCVYEPPPGRTSRVFLRVRYAFGLGGG